MDRVLHVALDFGLPSETFVADAVEFTEQDEWVSYLATGSLQNREWFPFPPDDRVHLARKPSTPWRIYQRLRLRRDADQTARIMWPNVQTIRPAVLHAHFGWAAIYATGFKRSLNAPLVTTFHASDVSVFPKLRGIDVALGRLQGRTHLLDRTLNQVDAAIAVSDWVSSELQSLGYEGRIEQIPVGIRTDRFERRPMLPPPAPQRVLYVGRLTERKGVDLILSAMPAVASAVTDIELVVIGDGPLRDRLEAAARETRTPVEFRGAQPPEEIARALAEAHLLVMASRTTASGEKESGPMVLKEAMAVGVPVVATDNGGTVDVLPPELRHEIVPENDVVALAERIIAVLNEPEDLKQKRIQQSHEWTIEQFDVREIGKRTIALYESLMQDGR